MFSKKKNGFGGGEEWSGFLDQAVKLEGTLEVSGGFQIDGQMKGTIHSADTLVVGESGMVEGGIQGQEVIIAGKFDGVIAAKGRVEIKATGVVTGEIQTSCLVIQPGGVFDGRCHMLPAGENREGAEPVTIPIRAGDEHPN